MKNRIQTYMWKGLQNYAKMKKLVDPADWNKYMNLKSLIGNEKNFAIVKLN